MEPGTFALLSCAAVLIFSASSVVSDGEDSLGIINGKPISIRHMPYIGALECYDTFVNGAIIISEYYILTFMDNHPDVGSCQLRTGTSQRLKGGVTYALSSSFCYLEASDFDDLICVDRVDNIIDFDDYTQMIPLGDKGISPGDVVTIGGWGVTSSTGPPSEKLRAVNATIVDLATCLEGTLETKDKALMCTKNGTISFGDYGSPVVHNGKAVGMVIRTFPDFKVPYDFYINLTHPKIRDFIEFATT